jgi:Zn-dependent peptidase ImmA (M78 family)
MFIINREIWYVKIVRPDYPLLKMPDGSFALGVCDDNYKVICINNQIHGRKFKEVLCHEIVHASMFSYNIYLDYDTEEFIANLISKYGEEIISITDKVFKNIKRGYL